MRNVFLQLNIDSELLSKRMFMPEEMTKTERDEAGEAAKRYGPQGIATMLKLLDGAEDDDHAQHVKVELDIKIDSSHKDAFSEKRAKARMLLDWAHQQGSVSTGQIVEGESKVLD